MKNHAEKMVLQPADAARLQKVQQKAQAEYLVPDRLPANVIGMASGTKWSNGEATGEPALLVLVTHKVAEDQLAPGDRVPAQLAGVQTDVLAIGQPMAQAPQGGRLAVDPRPEADNGRGNGHASVSVAEAEAVIHLLATRVRPAEGGYSVAHKDVTAGTIATCVYDMLPGGSSNPPSHGVGIPPRYYILSNNHVLANSNVAVVGDPVLQPGPADGGTLPADRIGQLSRFIPITFEPPTPRANHRNLVDAAVAEVGFHDCDREIHWVGNVRGWRTKANVTVGTIVQKTGRTTNYTLGRITAVNATVDINFGGGRVARFIDQIITTPMSAGGDSGSLVTTVDEVAVGLLFAGSDSVTILNQIENVRALLKVEVAEQIL